LRKIKKDPSKISQNSPKFEKYQKYYNEFEIFSSPLLYNDIFNISDKTPIPGNIRKINHFLGFVKRIIIYLKHKVLPHTIGKQEEKNQEIPRICISPLKMRYELVYDQFCDIKAIKALILRLSFLLYTLKIKNPEKYSDLIKILEFVQIIATYSEKFTVFIDPQTDQKKAHQYLKVLLQIACLDSSLNFNAISKNIRNFVLSGPNFTPLEIYEKLLNTKFLITRLIMLENKFENIFCPLILSKANDNVNF